MILVIGDTYEDDARGGDEGCGGCVGGWGGGWGDAWRAEWNEVVGELRWTLRWRLFFDNHWGDVGGGGGRDDGWEGRRRGGGGYRGIDKEVDNMTHHQRYQDSHRSIISKSYKGCNLGRVYFLFVWLTLCHWWAKQDHLNYPVKYFIEHKLPNLFLTVISLSNKSF